MSRLALELRAAALRAREARRQELLDGPLVPRVGAVLVEDRRRALDRARRQDGFAAGSCSRPPGSARPTRAGARCTSRAGSRSCCGCGRGPTRESTARRVDRRRARHRAACVGVPPSRDRRFAVHSHEPLRRRQEDDRVVAAPAVRVLCVNVVMVPQPSALVQRLDRRPDSPRTPVRRRTAARRR